jgi:hypothetical protein
MSGISSRVPSHFGAEKDFTGTVPIRKVASRLTRYGGFPGNRVPAPSPYQFAEKSGWDGARRFESAYRLDPSTGDDRASMDL